MRTLAEVARYLISFGNDMRDECEFEAAREAYRLASNFLNENISYYAMNAGHALADMRAKPRPTQVAPEGLPRKLQPYDYEHVRELSGRFM